MWEWLKRQFRSLINFFSSLWSASPPMPHYAPAQEALSDIKAFNISALLEKTKDPIHELKEKHLRVVSMLRNYCCVMI